jgi:putative transposase
VYIGSEASFGCCTRPGRWCIVVARRRRRSGKCRPTWQTGRTRFGSGTSRTCRRCARSHYLYLISDLYSRKVVGWEMYEVEIQCRRAAGCKHQTGGRWEEAGVACGQQRWPDEGLRCWQRCSNSELISFVQSPHGQRNDAPTQSRFSTPEVCTLMAEEAVRDNRAGARAWVRTFVTWYNTGTPQWHSSSPGTRPGLRLGSAGAQQQCPEAGQGRQPERWSSGARDWTPLAGWRRRCKRGGT